MSAFCPRVADRWFLRTTTNGRQRQADHSSWHQLSKKNKRKGKYTDKVSAGLVILRQKKRARIDGKKMFFCVFKTGKVRLKKKKKNYKHPKWSSHRSSKIFLPELSRLPPHAEDHPCPSQSGLKKSEDQGICLKNGTSPRYIYTMAMYLRDLMKNNMRWFLHFFNISASSQHLLQRRGFRSDPRPQSRKYLHLAFFGSSQRKSPFVSPWNLFRSMLPW